LKLVSQTSSQRKRAVLDDMPESYRQEIAQNNMAQLTLQNRQSMLSNTDLNFQHILAVTQQGISNFSVSSYQPKQQCFSKFFIIKSFTEDDVHKAIKYNIWSSTVTGNAVLNKAYLDVQRVRESKKDLDKDSDNDEAADDARGNAEVYLLFSVNQSKHFCGVAKMMSSVRHDVKHDNLWKQSGKWPGSIKLQWIFVKDIPNTQFIHIENPLNENKPVCQGRDCQEIYSVVGERMLQIFAGFKSLTRIYDDFMIYDEKEKQKNLKLIMKQRFNQKYSRQQYARKKNEFNAEKKP
jgi:hypothetical protein